jgi:transposase InsO family protein
MLQELRVAEQRLRAVWEVLDGASVSEVARRFAVSRCRVHGRRVSGIDDSSRFAISAQLVRRATADPVCEALLAALRRLGIPDQILTDKGKSLHRQVRARGEVGGGVVRPDLRGERDPASVDRAAIADHHREGGAVA